VWYLSCGLAVSEAVGCECCRRRAKELHERLERLEWLEWLEWLDDLEIGAEP
jgi:hypothetical protein